MNQGTRGRSRVGGITLTGGQTIMQGASVTRHGVRLDGGDDVGIGSLYLSDHAKLYFKTANAKADTDWEKVTTSAAD